jgi:hypothetical protein
VMMDRVVLPALKAIAGEAAKNHLTTNYEES